MQRLFRLFRRADPGVKTTESWWSFGKTIWDIASGYGVVVLGMLTAAVATLYSAAAWISQFGAAGWILAAVAAIFISSLVIGTVSWAIQRVREVRAQPAATSDASATRAERERTKDEALRQLNRSAFLLLAYNANEAAHRSLWKAYKLLPAAEEGESDEALLKVTNGLKDYFSRTEIELGPTRWWQEFRRINSDAAHKADIDLRSKAAPNQFNPYVYRDYYIAIQKRNAIDAFLKEAIEVSESERDSLVGMMGGRKDLHNKP